MTRQGVRTLPIDKCCQGGQQFLALQAFISSVSVRSMTQTLVPHCGLQILEYHTILNAGLWGR